MFFPKLSPDVFDTFCGLIAIGPYKLRRAKITHIRNPVVRCAPKIINNAMYFKADSGSVTETELPKLFYGVKHLLDEFANLP